MLLSHFYMAEAGLFEGRTIAETGIAPRILSVRKGTKVIKARWHVDEVKQAVSKMG